MCLLRWMDEFFKLVGYWGVIRRNIVVLIRIAIHRFLRIGIRGIIVLELQDDRIVGFAIASVE